MNIEKRRYIFVPDARKEEIALLIIVFALWIIFSGNIEPTTCLIGLIVSFLVTFFCIKIFDYKLYTPLRFIKKAAALIFYVIVLVKEIILANVAVLKILYSKKKPEARLVHFKGDLEGDGANVLVANSITLTPGTITVDLKDGNYVVHALDKSLAGGMKDLCFFENASKVRVAGIPTATKGKRD